MGLGEVGGDLILEGVGVLGLTIWSLTVLGLRGLPIRGLLEAAGDLGDPPVEVAASEGAELCPATTDLPRVGLASWIAASSTPPSRRQLSLEEAFCAGGNWGPTPLRLFAISHMASVFQF